MEGIDRITNTTLDAIQLGIKPVEHIESVLVGTPTHIRRVFLGAGHDVVSSLLGHL